MKASTVAAVGTAVGVAAVVVVGLAINAAINYGQCQWYGYQTDRTVKYAMGVGCMVKKDTGWTPKAELRTEQ
ncbi:hypothetical protein HOV23_gp046 [Pseudomonas phage Lana]|uniref:Uncharacterized protein n=1 Tax=Pseudomonas phage Lana TaxID=2530172 RepID=A0A481W6L4_9CAUD|nr:hypothetical protein HOV23_gp046 [Pseudomonas phage Lana]QBJ04527.1 hypothetical protein [Pseudomonas phage Lana]